MGCCCLLAVGGVCVWWDVVWTVFAVGVVVVFCVGSWGLVLVGLSQVGCACCLGWSEFPFVQAWCCGLWSGVVEYLISIVAGMVGLVIVWELWLLSCLFLVVFAVYSCGLVWVVMVGGDV